ncbi:hypothetical protein LguiB_018498 [Lonicera macranthoides]
MKTRPSKEFKENLAKVRTSHSGKSSTLDLKKIWLSGDGCPTGSIPLRRYSKSSKLVTPPGRLEFAGMTTTVQKEYDGASAVIDVYKPSVSDSNQFSAAGIIVLKGDDQIQAGWIVNPGLYSDQSTHFYTRWTSGDGRGCYNSICSGFVSVNEKVPVDFAFIFTSILEGEQFEVSVSVNLDPKTRWWLSIYNDTNVGYWPNELFVSMNGTPADTIKWGGQVNTTTGVSPPMGASQFKNGNYNKTCYMRQVKVNTPNLVDLDNSFSTIAESRCYFTGDNSFKDEYYHRFSFLFGGRGGDKYQCF